MGGELAGPEKLGLAPKVLQNLWGSAEPFFNKLFTMRNVLQILPAEPLEALARLFTESGPANSSPKIQISILWVQIPYLP